MHWSLSTAAGEEVLYVCCCTVCVVLCVPCVLYCVRRAVCPLTFSHSLTPPSHSHSYPPHSVPPTPTPLSSPPPPSLSSSGSKIWAAHPEWQLKDDSGKVIMHGAPVMDARQPAFRAFWVGHLVNLTKVVDPKTGKPLIDMIYCDGMDGTTPPTPLTGLTPAESEAYYQGTSLSTQRVSMF